ncbi:MAG: hypothetical protein KGJ52_05375 [Gammaproteobacteria bacterium]|nr:hypothetical protein [Gammaproteobacteria bacterium]
MRVPARQRISRRVALLAAIGLHLLGGLLFSGVFHSAPPALPVGPVMVWIGWPLAAVMSARPAPQMRPRPRMDAAAGGAATPPAPPMSPPTSAMQTAATAPAQPATHWNMEAARAAAAVINRAAVDQKRGAAMGSIPKSPFAATAARPAFPWSRQPLGRHFDADPHTGLVSLRGNRCMIGLVFILPVFGCAVGHIDPEPGEADLFDPKYRPQPLELPASLDTVR